MARASRQTSSSSRPSIVGSLMARVAVAVTGAETALVLIDVEDARACAEAVRSPEPAIVTTAASIVARVFMDRGRVVGRRARHCASTRRQGDPPKGWHPLRTSVI